MATRGFDSIQIKSGTLAEWLAYNPILKYGEEGYITDKHVSKHGDGIHRFSDLPYDNDPSENSYILDLVHDVEVLQDENIELRSKVDTLVNNSTNTVYTAGVLDNDDSNIDWSDNVNPDLVVNPSSPDDDTITIPDELEDIVITPVDDNDPSDNPENSDATNEDDSNIDWSDNVNPDLVVNPSSPDDDTITVPDELEDIVITPVDDDNTMTDNFEYTDVINEGDNGDDVEEIVITPVDDNEPSDNPENSDTTNEDDSHIDWSSNVNPDLIVNPSSPDDDTITVPTDPTDPTMFI